MPKLKKMKNEISSLLDVDRVVRASAKKAKKKLKKAGFPPNWPKHWTDWFANNGDEYRIQDWEHRILICGDRFWSRGKAVIRELHNYSPYNTLIIQGCADGADIDGWMAGRAMGFEVACFNADWDRFRRSAGPIRNRQQYKAMKPTEVWAYHADLENSSGTKDMVGVARKGGTQVKIFKG